MRLQTCNVRIHPLLSDFPVHHTIDTRLSDLNFVAGGFVSKKLALMSPCRSKVADHEVTVDENVLDLLVPIWKCRTMTLNRRLNFVMTIDNPASWKMTNEVLGIAPR